ncbi:MAG: carboxypeptidase regulatory-like domain-containing protein [Gemmatimonadota bacterium]|jgi:hypothetical protein
MSTIRTLVLALLALVAASIPLRAQAVLGRVVDEATSGPVSWAELTLLGEEGDTLETVVADSTGWFLFHPHGPGPYRLRVSRIGYRSATVGALEMKPYEAMTLEVRLAAEAVALEPLRVIAEPRDPRLEDAGFYRRRRYEHGVFLTPLEIEARQAVFTEDLFRGIPNLRVYEVIGGKVIWLGRTGCPPTVYVQGHRRMEPGYLPTFDPGAIRAIEVYRGPSETPVEYGGTDQYGTVCGAVLFWLY